MQNQINLQLIEIEKKISENSQALIEAQIVKFRSTISKSNNFIETISKNVYKGKIDESINWHQEQLKELYFKRKLLKTNLEKIKGIFWINRIKRLIQAIFIGSLILLILLIFLSGFMVLIYLLPLILMTALILLIFKKN